VVDTRSVAATTPGSLLQPTDADLVRSPMFAPLDAFRALGIITVSAGHQFSLDQLAFPTFGTRLIYHAGFMFGLAFFLLSGFLLFRPFAGAILDGKSTSDPARFIWRRLWRIVPAYWLVLTIALVFDDTINKPSSPLGFVAVYTFVYPYVPSFARFGIVQAWTICAEMVFYLSLPFIARALANWTRPMGSVRARQSAVTKVLAGVILAAIVLRFGFSTIGRNFAHAGYSVNYSFYNYLDWFALGMLIALIREGWARGIQPPRWIMHMVASPGFGLLVAAGLWWTAVQLHHPMVPVVTYPSTIQYVLRLVILSFAVGAMVIPFAFRVHVPGSVASFLSGPGMSFAAKVSYGYFLWHFGVIHWFERKYGYPTSMAELAGRWVWIASICFLLGALSYVLVEHPIVKWSERRWKARMSAKEPKAVVDGG
jgi:peptidoglycan/LPS O-acetylase OafA/YrhL